MPDEPPPLSVSQVEQEAVHSPFERMEPKKTENLVLFSKRLVEEQKQLCQLREWAVSELESCKVPMCYFVRDDILMHKWRPRKVPSSEAWRVLHQVVAPPMYQEDVWR